MRADDIAFLRKQGTECREMEREAQLKAESALTPEVRARWTAIANEWRSLSDSVEELIALTAS
jgi:lambda repressor-like predicted transcriptional regulator